MDDEKICTVCHTPVSQWPMCFRGDPQCSVICRKKAEREAAETPVVVAEVTLGADE